MNKTVRAHYPAEKLPQELREGLAPGARVTVTIEDETKPESVMTLEDIFATRRPPFRSRSEIDADLRTDREEWGG